MTTEQHKPKLSIHSGDGHLRGGGIRQGGAKAVGHKLERRLGPVLLLCLAITATALLINGLFHESSRGALLEFVDGLGQEILLIQQHELAEFAGEPEATTVRPAEEDGSNDTAAVPRGGGGDSAMRTLLRRRSAQMAELDSVRELFREIDLTLWSLVLLSVLGMALMGAGMFLLYRQGRGTQQRKCRIIYRIILALLGLLLLIQLLLLLFSLLPCSLALPSAVDRLLLEYLLQMPEERRPSLAAIVEEEFACKIRVEHELLERLGLQEQCLPKIKDRLLAPYIVIFLIFVLLWPFLFAVFTFLWTTRLKEWEPVKEARKRIESSQYPADLPRRKVRMDGKNFY